MKKLTTVPILFIALLFNGCGLLGPDFNCDFFERFPDEKKKKDILDILSAGHWYLAEYYIDGVDAIDTARKYRVGEDVWFESYPTTGLSCERKVTKLEFNMFFKNYGQSSTTLSDYERVGVGKDTFFVKSVYNNYTITRSIFKFNLDGSNTVAFYLGGNFIYYLSDTNQLKNKDYIKFPFGGTSYFDSTTNKKKYYEAKFTIEDLNTTLFYLKTKFFGVIYQFKFKKKP